MSNITTLLGAGIVVGDLTDAYSLKDYYFNYVVAGTIFSFIASMFTGFGLETMTQYRRTRNGIKHGHLNLVDAVVNIDKASYCSRKGIELAVSEAEPRSNSKDNNRVTSTL